MAKNTFSACPLGKLQLRSICPEFICTCPDFFLPCAASPFLWRTKCNRLLISLKYCSVNVNIFIASGSALFAQSASCLGTSFPCIRTHLPQASQQGFRCALPYPPPPPNSEQMIILSPPLTFFQGGRHWRGSTCCSDQYNIKPGFYRWEILAPTPQKLY